MIFYKSTFSIIKVLIAYNIYVYASHSLIFGVIAFSEFYIS
jgi:hypothetical protein